MPKVRTCVLLASLATAPPCVAATPARELIGSWVLTCPAGKSSPCLMRTTKRFIGKAGVTGDLEVQAKGNLLVPVLILRGLPHEMLMAVTMAGKAEASIQYPGAPAQGLACAASSVGYICSPEGLAGKKLAAGLPSAKAATVRLSVTISGLRPLPAQERSVALAGTAEALDRLRSLGPTQLPAPLTEAASGSPTGLMGMADKMLKAAGYANGVAGLRSIAGRYLEK